MSVCGTVSGEPEGSVSGSVQRMSLREKNRFVPCFHTKLLTGNFCRQKQLGKLCENSIKMYLIGTDFEDVKTVFKWLKVGFSGEGTIVM